MTGRTIASMKQLRHAVDGNTLMLFAFALLPLMGMVGGAMDVSREYLVKSRLQQACDAAVLAGRRSMTGSEFDKASEEAANRFFVANFNQGRYGSRNSSIVYQVSSDMIVRATAKATVPMTVMAAFKQPAVDVEVKCEAQLQLPNSDIMFVLDTTLSMGETNPGDNQSRIKVLRKAVVDFYSTLDKAKRGNVRVRYGFVPYSSTVNVGMLLKREWMVDDWTYQSREKAQVTTTTSNPQGSTTTSYSAWQYISGTVATTTSTLPPESCVAPANTTTSSTSYTAYVDVPQPNGDVWRTREATQTINGSSYSVSLSNGVCTLTRTQYTSYAQKRTETVKPNPNAGQTSTVTNYFWNYKPVSYNLGSLKGSLASGLMAGGSFVAQIGNNHANRTISWPGTTGACIEERQTSSPNNGELAYDLDVDLVPNPADPRTQWRPAIPALVYARAVGNYANPSGWNTATVNTTSNYINLSSYPNDRAACPSAARKLAEMTNSSINAYLNTLNVAGLTYHDVGFLWGLRLMSPQGLFASENATAPNGGSISRHLIFMTDGATETNIADYDAYGLSALDRRRTAAASLPTSSAQNAIVETRLLKLCKIAKEEKNITVWVIAFGTTLTQMLKDCASPNRAYQANDSVQLSTTFAEIAARISQLRVTH
jgi:Flp pilus assembly protein TadG